MRKRTDTTGNDFFGLKSAFEKLQALLREATDENQRLRADNLRLRSMAVDPRAVREEEETLP